jgi:hypothetical protein
MDVGEGSEEVALAAPRKGMRGVAEEQAKTEPKAVHRIMSVTSTAAPRPWRRSMNSGDHVLRVEHLPPRDHAQERQVEQEVAHRAAEDREEDRPRDHPRRVADLVADVADVVVAEVVVDRDEAALPSPSTKPRLNAKAPGGKVERRPA